MFAEDPAGNYPMIDFLVSVRHQTDKRARAQAGASVLPISGSLGWRTGSHYGLVTHNLKCEHPFEVQDALKSISAMKASCFPALPRNSGFQVSNSETDSDKRRKKIIAATATAVARKLIRGAEPPRDKRTNWRRGKRDRLCGPYS
jgi:hypothetical protein